VRRSRFDPGNPRGSRRLYRELANWLEVLKNDKRAIFSAAAHAQKAADYLTRLQAKDSEQAAA
jgi:antirestriction protein ArdC